MPSPAGLREIAFAGCNVLSSRMPWDIVLIFFVLGVIVPWRGRAKLQQLLAKPSIESAERLSLYRSTIAFQWLAAAVAAWRAWAHGYTAAQLGLVVPGRWKISIIAILGTAVIVALQWLNLRRMRQSTGPLRRPLQALAERILPRTNTELISFIALAVTAGLCEEFLYRGFAMAVLFRLGLPAGVVIVCSSIIFGMAHLYQGKAGLVSTTVLGILFGSARVALGSIVPIMAWHLGVDLVAGIAGPRYLINSKAVSERVPVV
ncbi:MAG TPA: CPBP family intramembrane glutamic endopeptidase [Candidatus Acidoferrum sp.]|nr:CPBP family intramembrane glutamic endopeptidase [Candidatus Acidoferrum sp.]